MKKTVVLILLGLLVYMTCFWRLDGARLWRDEASTANWARAMVQNNSWVPKVWDGQQLMVHGADGHDFDENFIPMMQSWGQFYVCALAFKLFGVSTFTARLLFALFAAMAAMVMYFITKKIFKQQWIAYLTTFITLISSHYLTFARHARYYSMVYFFSLLIIYEIMSYFADRTRGDSWSFYLRLYLYGLGLYFSNYFSLATLWIPVGLLMLVIRDRKVTIRFIIMSILLLITIIPEFLLVHLQFLPQSSASSNEWMLFWENVQIVFKRVRLILPLGFIVPASVLVFLKQSRTPSSMKWQLGFLLTVFIVTPLLALFITGERAIIRYYVFIIPVAILLMIIVFERLYRFIGPIPAWIVLLVLLFYHQMNFAETTLDKVVPYQFAKDNRTTDGAFEFIRKNIKPTENVAFVRNTQGQLAFFYFPWLRWCRILDHSLPKNQAFRDVLPARIFDDYEDIDWYILWDLKEDFVPSPDQYELVYEYRWDHPRRWYDESRGQRFKKYQFYRRIRMVSALSQNND